MQTNPILEPSGDDRKNFTTSSEPCRCRDIRNLMQPLRRLLSLAVAFVALRSTDVCAEEPRQVCRDPLADWRVDAGELRRGAQCGTFIGTTDANTGLFSFGRYALRTPVDLPFEFQVTWRRLSHERSLEIGVLGAVVLLNDNTCGKFVNNPSFVWDSLPGYRPSQQHTITVRQDAKQIVLLVDGAKACSWAFAAPVKRGELSVGFKAPSGDRARLLFRDVQVRPWANSPDNPPPHH
jgi:hypothetical protein